MILIVQIFILISQFGQKLSQTSSVQDIIDLKTPISKLTVQPSNETIDLYIASTNHLYKITDKNGEKNSLMIDVNLSTGPKAQKQQCAYITEYSSSISVQCIKYICDEESNLASRIPKSDSSLINNENRLLLIDEKNQHLIECGTVDYGGCRLRRLDTLDIIGCNYSAPVIPFSSAAGVVISSSVEKYGNRIYDSSLYLMVSNEYDPVERVARTDFPIFSTRYLATTHSDVDSQSQSTKSVFQSHQPLFQSKYPIESMNYDESIFDADFHMKIVYSFKHNGFIYFLFTITNKILSDSCNRIDADKLPNKSIPKIVTRMLRICDSKMFKNYQTDSLNSLSSILSSSATLTETTIDCDQNGKKFHLLQSARFHELKNDTTGDSILFLTFNNTAESTVCKIKLKQIDQHYQNMLKNCLKGDNTYAELVSPYSNKNTWKTPCRCSVINEFPYQTSREYNPSLFCQNDFFNYMNSRKTLSTESISFDVNIQSITALASLDAEHTDRVILIMASMDAKIYMFIHQLNTRSALVYDQINLLKPNDFYHKPSLSKSAALNINLELVSMDSLSRRLLYATYDKYLFKIDIHNCQRYQDCDTCRSNNPFCGWCVYTQKCTLKKHCLTQTNSYWIQKNSPSSERCPRIESVSPGLYFSPFLQASKTSEYKFLLNYKLKNDVVYTCSVLDKRVSAILSPDSNELSCNLELIKQKLPNNYVNSKFANLTLEIRTDKVLLAKSNLIAFNCSYFTDCNQCLEQKLSGSCSWCAKNAKCVFSHQTHSACPNEVKFYRLVNKDRSPSDICTTFSSSSQFRANLEIPYSADTSLTDHNKLYINNPYPEYQTSFKCIFTKDKFVHNYQSFNFTSTNLKWLSSDSDLKKSFFNCQYSPNKDKKIIDANLPMQTIYMSIWWSSSTYELNSSFDLLSNWHQVKFYTNLSQNLMPDSDFVQISVINCEIKASSCGKCMNKQLLDLGCGWCKSLSKCSMKSDCEKTGLDINWLNTTDTDGYCQNPKILRTNPVCGPKVGAGTVMTILGENLGQDSSEVEVKMKPIHTDYSNKNQDLVCQTLPHLYKPASKIACRTIPLNSSNSEFSIYVVTNVKSKSNTYSSFNKSNQFIFRYVTPQIEWIEPLRGIKSGGTILKIAGKNLKCGSKVEIKFLSVGKNCIILNKHSTNETTNLDIIYCRTPSIDSSQETKISSLIEFQMDDYSQVLDSRKFKFEYVPDPRIVDIEPSKTILSGGLTMKIKGREFDSVQSVSLILSSIPISNSPHISKDKMLNIFKNNCSIFNSSLIECTIPELKDNRLLSLNQEPVNYSFYIQFNELVNKFANENRQQLKVYPNPVFEDEQIFTDKSQIILIKGENLIRGVHESNYQVLIGVDNECNITSVTMNMIACILPDLDTLDMNKNSENGFFFIRRKRSWFTDSKSKTKSYEVKVKIGKHFVKPIGMIKHEVNLNNRFDLIGMRYIIYAACLISLVLFLTMIGFFVVLKRKQSKQIRQLKRMQTEFENLEMRVARECKEAFTELQMDIGELASTLNQTGAPFHDFQTYCMKIFFPNASETDKYYMTTMIDLRVREIFIFLHFTN